MKKAGVSLVAEGAAKFFSDVAKGQAEIARLGGLSASAAARVTALGSATRRLGADVAALPSPTRVRDVAGRPMGYGGSDAAPASPGGFGGQATADMERLTRSSGSATASVKELSKGIFETARGLRDVAQLGGMAFNAIAQGVRAVGELGELGLKAQQARLGFQAFSGGVDQATTNLVAMRAASGKALSIMEAQRQAASLLGMGLATNSEELERLTKTAVMLGSAFRGLKAPDAIQEFSLLLANQSVLRLDTFGISSGRVRERIKELQDQTKGMTREQAFLQATLEQASVSLAKLEAAGFQSATGIDRARSAWEDFKATLGQGIAPVVEGSADRLGGALDFGNKWLAIQYAITAGNKVIKETDGELKALAIDLRAVYGDIGGAIEMLKQNPVALAAFNEELRRQAEGLGLVQREISNYRSSLVETGGGLGKVTTETETAQRATDLLNAAMAKAGSEGAEAMLEALRETASEADRASEAYRRAETRIAAMIAQGAAVKSRYPEYFGKGSQPDVGLARFGQPGGNTSRAGGGDVEAAERQNQQDALKRWTEANNARQQQQRSFLSSLIDMERSTAQRLVELGQDRGKRLADVDRAAGAARLAAERQYTAQLASLAAASAKERVRAAADFAKEEARERQRFLKSQDKEARQFAKQEQREAADFAKGEAEAEEDYRRESIRAEEDYRRQLQDIERDSAKSIRSAIQARDGRALRDALIARAERLQEAGEEYQQQQERRRQDFGRQKEDRRRAFEEAQRDREAARREEQAEQAEAYREAQAERAEAYREEQAEREAAYREKLTDLQTQHQAELAEIETGLAKQRAEIEASYREQLAAARAAYNQRLTDLQESLRLEQLTTAQALAELAAQHHGYLSYLQRLYSAASFGVANPAQAGTAATPASAGSAARGASFTSSQGVVSPRVGMVGGTVSPPPMVQNSRSVVVNNNIGDVIVQGTLAAGVTPRDVHAAVTEALVAYDSGLGSAWERH